MATNQDSHGEKVRAPVDRRGFMKQVGYGLATGLATWGTLDLVFRSMNRVPTPFLSATEPGVLRPPGALEESRFLSACIRCQRCQDVCPSGAIRLAGPGDPAQLGTPYIFATDTACTLCLDCTLVCPTDALVPVREKSDVAMGTAVVDGRTCVSINGTGVCGACHTACPLKNKAITLGLHNAPKVIEGECVGCGLCEEACILTGTKAIRVFSNRRQA